MRTVMWQLRGAYPWFVGRPRLTAVTATLLCLAAVAMLATGGARSRDAPSLFCLPIALLATTFGLRGGVAGSAVAVAVLTGWGLTDHVGLDALGWLTRIGPLLLLGLLLGDAMDRLRRAEATRVRFEDAERRHREAIQLNDTIVQSLAAAKWALETSDLAGGLAIVDETLAQSNRLVSDLIRGAQLRPLWMGEATHDQPAPRRRRVADGELLGLDADPLTRDSRPGEPLGADEPG
ncbi:MAG TPA: hypothetical protein VI248_09395 [Kineosporiaceae bacterium]